MQQELDALRNIVLILYACLAIACAIALDTPRPHCQQHGTPADECRDRH